MAEKVILNEQEQAIIDRLWGIIARQRAFMDKKMAQCECGKSAKRKLYTNECLVCGGYIASDSPPSEEVVEIDKLLQVDGFLSRRDYFAMSILQGALAGDGNGDADYILRQDLGRVIQRSVAIADSLVVELDK
jgi:hypothetical protein